jgi:mono/diheme cytochrome c family protein
MKAALTLAVFCAAVVGCGERDAVERGAALFSSTELSPSPTNPVSCATCHATSQGETRILAGHSLAGVATRAAYFGGAEVELRHAVNYCMQRFMRAPTRETFDETDGRGLDLLAYLESLPPAEPDALAWTVADRVVPLPAGDAARGADVYERGCASCHGAKVTGDGRLAPHVSKVPTDTIAEHGEDTYLVTLQKVRWGQFRGFSGDMPPFSVERLGDADLADVAAYLGLEPAE